jgi:hypothetical protein
MWSRDLLDVKSCSRVDVNYNHPPKYYFLQPQKSTKDSFVENFPNCNEV